MRNVRSMLAGFGLAWACVCAGPALAQDMGFYAGIALGQSSADVDCSGTTACDDKDTAWKIFGGYQFNRNFAVELGYVNLGEVTASTPAFGPIPAASLTIESTAFEVVGVGILPLADRFSAYAKLGLYRADTDVDVVFAGIPGAASDSDDSTDLTFGIGARFDVTRNLGVRVEWQRYMDVKAADFGKSDIDVISLGALWRF